MQIIASLFKATIGLPELKLRLVTKFCENDFEKLDRLCDIHIEYSFKLKPVDEEIEEIKENIQRGGTEIDNDIETEFYLRRLEEGLLTLQLTDLIIVFLCTDPIVTDVRH